jgi:hypothetical protein
MMTRTAKPEVEEGDRHAEVEEGDDRTFSLCATGRALVPPLTNQAYKNQLVLLLLFFGKKEKYI